MINGMLILGGILLFILGFIVVVFLCMKVGYHVGLWVGENLGKVALNLLSFLS